MHDYITLNARSDQAAAFAGLIGKSRVQNRPVCTPPGTKWGAGVPGKRKNRLPGAEKASSVPGSKQRRR